MFTARPDEDRGARSRHLEEESRMFRDLMMEETSRRRFGRLPGTEDLPLPCYMTAQAAGMDLMAAVTADVTILPGERILIPTGIAVELPEGYEAEIRPRSGLALRHGVTLVNSPGTIDADYRGRSRGHPDQSRSGPLRRPAGGPHSPDGGASGLSRVMEHVAMHCLRPSGAPVDSAIRNESFSVFAHSRTKFHLA